MKAKIVILGLGGVGGYYGGMLSRKYRTDEDIDIYFVARGAHLEKIKQFGLTVKTETGTFVTYPTLATNNVEEIGVADYIIVTTKSYDLESTMEQIKPCVGKQTVILPLLNGVDITERIQKILPQAEVWQGCTYIVGRLIEPGVVESSGNIHLLYFGYNNKTTDRLLDFEKVLKEAGFDAHFAPNIMSVIWKKFFFISSTASLTSYFDVSFGALLEGERKETLVALLNELLVVAHAEGVEMDETVIDAVIRQLEELPYHTTSSMHSDFTAHRNTELETLTGIVLRLAEKHNLELPVYTRVYEALKAKSIS